MSQLEMVTVEDLYKHFAVLNSAKENATKHEESYKVLLGGLRSGSNEKRLASQFVARFFRFFPGYGEQCLESMFDLCEDPDITVRKQAIKDLPLICKACPSYCQKVSDIVTQLLQSSDPLETSLVQMSLMSMLRVDIKPTLAGIFGQIFQEEVEVVRTRAINFLAQKIKVLVSEELLAKDGAEEFLIAQIKKVVMVDVTGSEFISFMKILSLIPSMSSLQGRLHLLQIISEQADLSKDFDPSDMDAANCLKECIIQATQLFSKNVHSHQYVEYICLKVLPHLDEISSADIKLDLVKLLAEMIPFHGTLKSLDACIRNTFDALLSYMPLPPKDSGEAEIAVNIPKLQFSYVECLIFSFHHLARNAPQFLAHPENSDRLKDFRARLQYFARGVQGYIKSLKSALDATPSDEVKSLALKTTSNINLLVRDLFHNPPSYKAVVNLSFKKPDSSEMSKPGIKRAISTTDASEHHGKRLKSDKALYVPPSGKFSQRVGNFAYGGSSKAMETAPSKNTIK